MKLKPWKKLVSQYNSVNTQVDELTDEIDRLQATIALKREKRNKLYKLKHDTLSEIIQHIEQETSE